MGKIYSSHPVRELNAGGFQFKDGVLHLEDEDKIKEFEELLAGYAKTDPSIRVMIKEISVESAEEIARRFAKPTAVQGVATSESVMRAQQIADDAAKAVAAAAANNGDVDSAAKAAEIASQGKVAVGLGLKIG